MPAKCMRATASYAAARATATDSPTPVTSRMRPPFVTSPPSCSAVPAWNTSAPVASASETPSMRVPLSPCAGYSAPARTTAPPARSGAPSDAPDRAAVTVVLAGAEYPAHGDSGTRIDGVSEAEATGALVFHAGTALHEGGLVTNGGRILDVTGVGESVAVARAAAYEAVARIHFAGMKFRHDIADV